jgi:hypothetical protein
MVVSVVVVFGMENWVVAATIMEIMPHLSEMNLLLLNCQFFSKCMIWP